MLHVKQQAFSVKKQAGQTMVFALVFIVVILIGMVILFNTGQLTRHKMEVQNAADAAAYSAAILTARELNFMAYTNRAMVANQVTLGQFAAFDSWGKKYFLGSKKATIGYLQLAIALLPITAFDGGTTYNVISASMQALLWASDKINKIISVAMDILGTFAKVYIPSMQKLYVFHQKALTFGTLATQFDMLPKVIDDNASGATLSNLGALATFLSSEEQNLLSSSRTKVNSFLKTSDDKAGKRRFAAFVNDSRDGWTKDRSRSLGLNLNNTIPIGFAEIKTSGYMGFQDIEGGTDLRFLGKSEKYGWSSIDTVEGQFTLGISADIYGFCLIPDIINGGCAVWVDPPAFGFPKVGVTHLDFAGAAAETPESNNKSEKLDRNINKWKKTPYGEVWKNTGFAAKSAIIAGYQGQKAYAKQLLPLVPDYVDINANKYNAVNSAPTFLVSVRKNGDKLRTSDELDTLMNNGRFSVTTKLAGGRNGFGKTTEGDPANILGNCIATMVDAFKKNLLDKTQTPGGVGQDFINNLTDRFEKKLLDKVDDLQKMLNDAIPNSAAEKGGVFAMAAAEVYFKNPDENAIDVKASTFSPYWQVRLIPIDDNIRRWSVITQGLLLTQPNKSDINDEHLQNLIVGCS